MFETNVLTKIHEQFLIDKDKNKASDLIYNELKKSENTDYDIITFLFGKEFLPLQIKLTWKKILFVTSESSLPTIILAKLIMINKEFKEDAYLGWNFLKEHKKEEYERLKEESISYYIEVQKKSNSRIEINKDEIFKYLEYSISGSPFYDEIVSRLKKIYN